MFKSSRSNIFKVVQKFMTEHLLSCLEVYDQTLQKKKCSQKTRKKTKNKKIRKYKTENPPKWRF